MSDILNNLKSAQKEYRKNPGSGPAADSLPLHSEIKADLRKKPFLKKWLPLMIATVVLAGALGGTYVGYQRYLEKKTWKLMKIKEQQALLNSIDQKQELAEFRVLNLSGLDNLNNGQIFAAIKNFEDGLIVSAKYPPLFNNLGVALMNQGAVDKAIENFKKALEALPGYAEAHFNLAVAHEIDENYYEALIHYQKFIDVASDERYKDLKLKIRKHIGS